MEPLYADWTVVAHALTQGELGHALLMPALLLPAAVAVLLGAAPVARIAVAVSLILIAGFGWKLAEAPDPQTGAALAVAIASLLASWLQLRIARQRRALRQLDELRAEVAELLAAQERELHAAMRIPRPIRSPGPADSVESLDSSHAVTA
ncbi:hypothetical protein NK718_14630 [Alsobacter sp. SYSU M60028]|uniref:Uncharacterized protein n=1 Tax=Alsobacter ponti TaxID=2962936 RepID=A0ABT1LF68_9HYPH|nr:hypothetical protein [Alsobacter ponti]MCP8939761.1 hypothetical protein [Alsobacter ponti]